MFQLAAKFSPSVVAVESDLSSILLLYIFVHLPCIRVRRITDCDLQTFSKPNGVQMIPFSTQHNTTKLKIHHIQLSSKYFMCDSLNSCSFVQRVLGLKAFSKTRDSLFYVSARQFAHKYFLVPFYIIQQQYITYSTLPTFYQQSSPVTVAHNTHSLDEQSSLFTVVFTPHPTSSDSYVHINRSVLYNTSRVQLWNFSYKILEGDGLARLLTTSATSLFVTLFKLDTAH